MSDNLNDDIWLQVVKYLNLQDQLSLSMTCERMNFLVQTHWKSLKSATLTVDAQKYFAQKINIMHEFLQRSSGSLRHLNLEAVTVSLLASWKAYSFPKLIYLNYENRLRNMDQADKDTLRLSQLFPMVEHLRLQSKSSGLHLWLWDHMRTLNFVMDGPIETSHLIQAIKTCPLEKLTVLSYGFTCLCSIARHICLSRFINEVFIDDPRLLNAMIQLHTTVHCPTYHPLSFCIHDDTYNITVLKLIRLRCICVQSILINNAYESNSNLQKCIYYIPKLQHLTIQNDAIESNQLCAICALLNHLQKLSLIKMRLMLPAKDIWKAVAISKTIKVLDLSHNKLDEKWLELTTEYLDEILHSYSPSSPLILNAYNTSLERCPSKDKALFNHPYLNISFEPNDVVLGPNKNSKFVQIKVYDS